MGRDERKTLSPLSLLFCLSFCPRSQMFPEKKARLRLLLEKLRLIRSFFHSFRETKFQNYSCHSRFFFKYSLISSLVPSPLSNWRRGPGNPWTRLPKYFKNHGVLESNKIIFNIPQGYQPKRSPPLACISCTSSLPRLHRSAGTPPK